MDERQIQLRLVEARMDFQGCLDHPLGRLQVLLMLIHQPQIQIGPSEIWMQLNGFFQVGDGLCGLLQARERDDSQEMMGSRKTRKHFQGLLQGFGGLLEFLFVKVGQALVIQGLSLIGPACERKAEAQSKDQNTDGYGSQTSYVHNASILFLRGL